jgi:CelD/BcsL family acetyltransferase involved in cellulose biosynthesis
MLEITVCSPSLDIAESWRALVARNPANVFMSPVAMVAAAELEFSDIHVLQAWDAGEGSRRLVGVWALQRRARLPFLPATLLGLPYDYAFASVPVIDTACVDQVIPAFLDAIIAQPGLPRVLNLKSFDAESAVYASLQKVCAARGFGQCLLASNARPYVTRDSGLKPSGSTRKKLRQDWNRLSALGQADVVNDRTPEAVRAAFEIFLTLEQGSWKGASGTALLSSARDAEFARRFIAALAGEQAASVALLRVDGQAIAAQVVLYSGNMAYTWKTAFAGAYSKYSPGALLVDKITSELLALPDVMAIDSCSAASGFMAQLWAGRRTMVDILINLGPAHSPAFATEVAWERTYATLRSWRARYRASRWFARPKKVVAPTAQ